jgi:hypothetical protein
LKASDAKSAIKTVRNPGVGEILPAKPANGSTPKAAADQIADRPIDDVAKEISVAWMKSHAP